MNLTKSLPSRPILSLVPMPREYSPPDAAPDSLTALLSFLEAAHLLESAAADALNYCTPADLRDVQGRSIKVMATLEGARTNGGQLCKTA